MSDQLLQTTAWIDSDDGAKIFVWRWMPLSGARAIILIVHGMAEYSLRYERLARRLCEAGYGVWAADARGHGRTADLKVNNPGNGGLLGHCADKNGFFRVVSDLDIIAGVIKKEYPGLPLFMLGHSWGSFVAQNYI